jgi:hypothetical protein
LVSKLTTGDDQRLADFMEHPAPPHSPALGQYGPVL